MSRKTFIEQENNNYFKKLGTGTSRTTMFQVAEKIISGQIGDILGDFFDDTSLEFGTLNQSVSLERYLAVGPSKIWALEKNTHRPTSIFQNFQNGGRCVLELPFIFFFNKSTMAVQPNIFLVT